MLAGMRQAVADIELRLPAVPESIALARQTVRGIVDVLGWGDENRTDVSIAVTEACTNAVVHAYPPDVRGDFELLAWVEGDRLVVAVRDRGRGIIPSATSRAPGLRLGLPLIMTIGDEVTFTREDGVTEVTMVFSPGSRQENP